MATGSTNAIEVFYSYAHKDEYWRKRLETHLSALQRQGVIAGWHDRTISAGTSWASQIDEHLNRADIILLLISPDFIASDYCYSLEATRAMERHHAGTARVIPVILHPIDWKGVPFEQLQALPTNAKAITTWTNRNQAMANVAQGIRKVVEELIEHPLPISSSSSTIGNLPRRNPYFTGRQEILTAVHELLIANTKAALTQPPAISGLGGIGKTQTALEYAYRYRSDYHHLFWVKADALETLTADLVAIATLLNLPEQGEQDQTLILKAVKRWLQANANWLLIFDNADDLRLVSDFLPAGDKGHLLLTTRAHSMGGLAQRVEMKKMDPEQGALFLLRRAGMMGRDAPLSQAADADRGHAKDISTAMDGLPLALDQAGAFIEETACSLTDYLAIYRKQRADLLNQRGGIASPHPDPVAATWSLSFQKVEQANAAAAELLRVCAFLHPDAIPEELITQGASELGPVLHPVASDAIQLNRAIGELLKYSLVRRDPTTNTLSVHRLVQAVLRASMTHETQREWAERTVRAVDLAFPDVTDIELWAHCERQLSHALACAELVNEYTLALPQAARLLNDTAYYLYNHAQYEQARPLYERALAIMEKMLGPNHPNTKVVRGNLARLLEEMKQKKQQ